MPLTNHNTQIFQLETFGYKSAPSSDRECDYELLEEYGFSVIGTYMVKWKDFDFGGRVGQVRKKDIDDSHKDRMKISIKRNGITHWPIGERNEKTGLIELISGHHRITALMENTFSEEEIFPIMIVKREGSRLLKRLWMQAENVHDDNVCKPSTIDDAVLFLQELDDEFDYFKGLEVNKTPHKDKAYKLLTDYFPFIKASSKKSTYKNAFNNGKSFSTVKTLGKQEQIDIQDEIWGKVYGSNIVGNTGYIVSLWDPSRKSILIQCVKRALDLEEDSETKPMNMKLIIWFPSKVVNLVQQRRVALEELARMNNYVINSDLVTITEVAFPEQDTTKNTNTNHIYSWDSNKKEFV